jgi:hypothetical protein
LTLSCDAADECTSDIDASRQVAQSSPSRISVGDKFNIVPVYNNPFNIRSDTLDLQIFMESMGQQGTQRNENHMIKSVTLSGRTLDNTRVEIPLIPFQLIDKPIKGIGQAEGVNERIQFRLATPKQEEKFLELTLEIVYDYDQVSPGGTTRSPPKTLKSIFKNVDRNNPFTYVNPTATYATP